MRRSAILVSATLLLAAAVRLVGLTRVPPGPNPDEASNIVDAWSLAQTGADRYGNWLPIYLRGYDDYREALFTYLSLAVMASGDDSLFAIRLLAVVVGVVTVGLVCWLGTRMFSPTAGLLAGLFLAINPQHVLWSRLGMEVVLVPFATVLAWLAYNATQRGHRNGPVLLAGSLLSVIYSGMMGKPAALVLAAAFLARPGVWTTAFRRHPRHLICAGAILALGSIPGWQHTRSAEGSARFAPIRVHGETRRELAGKVAVNYLRYQSPAYWLPGSTIGLPSLPTAGKMGLFEWACLVLGVARLFRRWPKSAGPLLLFAVLSPVPAACTQTMAPSRVLYAVPVLAVIAGFGGAGLIERFGRPARVLVGAGALATLAWVAVDLRTGLNEHLYAFFYQPRYRSVRYAIDRRRDVDLVVIDAALPFAPIFAVYALRPPVMEFQGDATAPGATGLSVSNVITALPRPFIAQNPRLNVLVVTSNDRQVPTGTVMFHDHDDVVIEYNSD